jgi:hypothetical protein
MPMSEYPREVIHEAILSIAPKHVLSSGNCAQFAYLLNRLLGGDGTYVIIDSEHYEYADHVAVMIDGTIYDEDGASTEDEFQERHIEDEDEQSFQYYAEEEPDGTSVLRLADNSGCFGSLDPVAVERDLVKALDAAMAARNGGPRP